MQKVASDVDNPFGDVAVHCGVINLLEGFTANGFARDLSHEQHQWCGILGSDVDSRCGITCTGATADKTDPGPVRQLTVGVGHHRRTAFLAADHGTD